LFSTLIPIIPLRSQNKLPEYQIIFMMFITYEID